MGTATSEAVEDAAGGFVLGVLELSGSTSPSFVLSAIFLLRLLQSLSKKHFVEEAEGKRRRLGKTRAMAAQNTEKEGEETRKKECKDFREVPILLLKNI